MDKVTKSVRKPPAKGGSRKGIPNKTTGALKDAILKAAELSGRDSKGKDGLVGYLQRVADEDVKAFSGLLGKVLPLQVTGADGGAIQTDTTWTVKLVRADANPS